MDYTDNIIPVLRARLVSLQARHIFLVHGKNSYGACGAAQAVGQTLDGLSVSVTNFNDFSANPKQEDASIGLQSVLQNRPDVIVAIGGGSCIDMAKLIRHYAAERGYRIPLLAIPTTAGTGAEATRFAVVYKNGKKCSVEADDIQPDAVILYPPFTFNNDAYLTACTGFDALAQAIEAFWNPNATVESDNYALLAIAHIHHRLPLCVRNPEVQYLREELLLGSYYAGLAINITKTTAPHAFSYAFTTHCGYPHGHAVAITFPFFAKLNLNNNIKRTSLLKALELKKDTDLQNYFTDYLKQVGLVFKGTNGTDLKSLLLEVNADRLRNNPVKVTNEIISQLQNYIESLCTNRNF